MSSSSSSAEARPRLHLDYVDGLRAVAALTVYVNHVYGMVWNPYLGFRATGLLAPARYFLVLGHLSVTVFIVVSGYCLSLPVVDQDLTLRGGTHGFFKRRARRILPPYYAALVLCLIMIGTFLGKQTWTLWDVPIQVNTVAVVSHFLLLQDLFGTGRINYVFWSIAVEWQIYFVMPMLVRGWRRYGIVAVAAIALVVGYGLAIGLGHTRVARANPHFLGMFALGMLAAQVVRSQDARWLELRDRFHWGLVALGGAGAALALMLAWGVETSTDRFPYIDFPVGLMTAALLIHAARPNTVAARFFSFRPLVFVGTFSYSVYLMHAPLLQIQWQFALDPLGIGRNLQFWLMLGPGLVFVLAASYVFHRLFEAPFMGGMRVATPKPALAGNAPP
jgi:peptidoglycan/LPS O-acetylase OafA/YrhL